MKLLGLLISDHDANLCLYSDGTIRYHKYERSNQIKHYGSNNIIEWVTVVEQWGVNADSIDEFCISVGEENRQLCEHVFSGKKVHYIDHHLAHALSVFPVGESSVDLVFDGDGDDDRSMSVFDQKSLIYTRTNSESKSFGTILEELAPHHNVSGHILDLAGKMMGLKSYGDIDHQYAQHFRQASIHDLGKIADISKWESFTNRKFTSDQLDFLSTIHSITEEKFVDFFKQYKSSTISYSGGIAQNSVINGKLQKEIPHLIIPPHAGDEGLSIGCLAFLLKKHDLDCMKIANFPYCQSDQSPESVPSDGTVKKVAELLANKKIVGWYQGNGEIGPRALGNRSILMDPTVNEGKAILNSKVKFREEYRPYGCSVLEEHKDKYFEMSYNSPYMLHVVPCLSSSIPSVMHVDKSSRVQTVGNTNLLYRKLITEFEKLTGVPLLLNTSLNVNKKPIAGSIQDALTVFENSGMDAICIGSELYIK